MTQNSVIDLRYQELAVTIVAQACEDYCMSKRVLADKTANPDKIKEAKELIDECLDFFYSDNFRLFSNFDMPVNKLIARLDKVAKTDERQYIKFTIHREGSGEND